MEELEEENIAVALKDCFVDLQRGLSDLEDMVRNMFKKNTQETLEINGLESTIAGHGRENGERRKQGKKVLFLDYIDDLNGIQKKNHGDNKEEDANQDCEQAEEDKETFVKTELSLENEHIHDYSKQYKYCIERKDGEKRIWQIFGHWMGHRGQEGRRGEGKEVQLLSSKVKVRKKNKKGEINNRLEIQRKRLTPIGLLYRYIKWIICIDGFLCLM